MVQELYRLIDMLLQFGMQNPRICQLLNQANMINLNLFKALIIQYQIINLLFILDIQAFQLQKILSLIRRRGPIRLRNMLLLNIKFTLLAFKH